MPNELGRSEFAYDIALRLARLSPEQGATVLAQAGWSLAEVADTARRLRRVVAMDEADGRDTASLRTAVAACELFLRHQGVAGTA